MTAPERKEESARFANVSCSQCGHDFGPGHHGFSLCREHTERGIKTPPFVTRRCVSLTEPEFVRELKAAGPQVSDEPVRPLGRDTDSSPAHPAAPFYSPGAGPSADDWRCSYDGAYMLASSGRCRRCDRERGEA